MAKGGIVLGALKFVLGLDGLAFEKGATAADKQLKSLERGFKKSAANIAQIGERLTLGVTTPLLAIGAAAMKGAQDQREAMAQVEAALKSMGPAAGRTAQQLEKAADALEMRSLNDGDEILIKVTANLLTFGNVSGKVFDRAQQAAVDLAQRMKTDLQSATLMVGKALNDPVKGITALSRAGIQFTAQQKEQIKAMVAAGNAAGAQAIMLGELERQFGGAAKAAADVTPWRQAKVAMDQAADSIGEALLPIIPPVANALRDMALAFGQLSPQVQQFVIIGAGVAAAIGPILVAFGALVSATAPVLAGLAAMTGAAGFAALAPLIIPIAAAVTAVVLAWRNWDEIEPRLMKLKASIAQFAADVKTNTEPLAPAVSAFIDAWARGADEMQANLARYDAMFARFVAVWGEGSLSLQQSMAMADAAIARFAAAGVENMQRLYTGVKTWVVDKLNAIWNGVASKVEWVADKFKWLDDVVVRNSYIPDMVDSIGQHMGRLDANMVKPAQAATTATEKAFRELQQRVQPILDRLFPGEAAFNQLKKESDDLAKYAANKRSGLTPEQGAAMQRALRTEGLTQGPSIAEGLGDAPLIANDNDWTKPLENAAKAVSDNFAKPVRDQTLMVIQSFADMTRDVTSSLGSLVNNVKNGDWLGALTSVIDIIGQATGLLGGTAAPATRTYGIEPRALGGPVAANRTYLVGERGPELFTPRGSGSITANKKLSGGGVTIHQSLAFSGAVDLATRTEVYRVADAARQAAMIGIAEANKRRG